MWNQYDAAGEGVARTTNSVEGWHYGLQAYLSDLSGSTPNIWFLLRNLEKDSKMQKFKYIIYSRNCRIIVLQVPPTRKN